MYECVLSIYKWAMLVERLQNVGTTIHYVFHEETIQYTYACRQRIRTVTILHRHQRIRTVTILQKVPTF